MNSDYFSFHIKRKMQKRNENERVLNVLSAVMKNCDVEVLPSISDIVSDVSHFLLVYLLIINDQNKKYKHCKL